MGPSLVGDGSKTYDDAIEGAWRASMGPSLGRDGSRAARCQLTRASSSLTVEGDLRLNGAVAKSRRK